MPFCRQVTFVLMLFWSGRSSIMSAVRAWSHHTPRRRPVILSRHSFMPHTTRALSIMLMTSVDSETTEKTITSLWDVKGLKQQVARLILRSHKKIGKANQRLIKARETLDRLASNDAASSLEELEQCPDVDALELELSQLHSRLQGLNVIEQGLQKIKKKQTVLEPDLAALALELGVDDCPPPRPERGASKRKGPRSESKSRLPYRRYYSSNNIEIRVGKKAEDNDELSLSPKHRDGSDWWMHASGCPGSHVVIRCGDQNLPEEVVKDAAALAARQSKCQGSVIKVSMTRCRDVKKPSGAKPGLVQLTGKVRTVSVNMKEAAARFQRLEDTVLIN